MVEEVRRFRDPDLPLEAYLDVVLVRCPSCDACARVALVGEDRRLTCLACGHARERVKPKRSVTGAPIDPWFELPLWLRAEVKGEALWAYNAEHLALLRDFVAATHRTDEGTRNHMRSLANRLPKWMGLASNRAVLLRAIDRLAATLPQ